MAGIQEAGQAGTIKLIDKPGIASAVWREMRDEMFKTEKGGDRKECVNVHMSSKISCLSHNALLPMDLFFFFFLEVHVGQ